MQLLIGFLIGLASSAVVAYVMYRRQRTEQLQAEGTLLQRIAEQGQLVGVAAASSLVAVGSTGRLERDVSILRRQVIAALDSRETVGDRQVDVVGRIVGANGVLDARLLSELHRALLGDELDYAGELRDVPVRIGGAADDLADILLAPSPSEVRNRVRELLEAWARTVEAMPRLTAGERLERIVGFHTDLIAVHPFFDGNGLLARALLAVQTEEYLGQRVVLPRRDTAYFTALRHAFRGARGRLIAYVKARMERAAQQADEADEG